MVGEESSFVRRISDEIVPFVQCISGLMPSAFFRMFCDKFAVKFIGHFLESIVKQKRISETGAQQLLLDSYLLKKLALELPLMGGGVAASGMYTKQVSERASLLEDEHTRDEVREMATDII